MESIGEDLKLKITPFSGNRMHLFWEIVKVRGLSHFSRKHVSECFEKNITKWGGIIYCLPNWGLRCGKFMTTFGDGHSTKDLQNLTFLFKSFIGSLNKLIRKLSTLLRVLNVEEICQSHVKKWPLKMQAGAATGNPGFIHVRHFTLESVSKLTRLKTLSPLKLVIILVIQKYSRNWKLFGISL